MDWQQTVSLAIVVAAGIGLLRAKFRPRKFSLKHGSPCGCGSVKQSAPQSSILFRARKGERPQVIVKMR